MRQMKEPEEAYQVFMEQNGEIICYEMKGE